MPLAAGDALSSSLLAAVGVVVADAGAVSPLFALAVVAVAIALVRVVWRCLDSRRTPAIVSGTPMRKMRIIFASQKGTARGFAHRIFTAVSRWRSQSAAHAAYLAPPELTDAAGFEAECLQKDDLVIFVLATYTDGGAPASCEQFRADLCDMSSDFRYGGAFLATQTAFVFGLGDVAYAENFNRFAKDACDWLKSLGATRAAERFASEKKAQPLVVHFIGDVVEHLDKIFAARTPQLTDAEATGGGVGAKSNKKVAEDGVLLESESDDGDDGDDEGPAGPGVEDLEDMAGMDAEGDGRGQLLYPRLRQSLTKQGYRLVGSHSGVKLCRWTKAMLRGRGGCYKHTFYNISSYQCMEMTPSLACANKCVFCWRHHTNPVGKEFTWQVDPPDFLVDGAIAAHQGMLKPMKGVPGVTVDRLADAMNVKHCALSLVGEPIMYPRISEFVDILHAKHISTFMVTNAQFPDRIEQLRPVTQLYLSIDAATKEELKEIDRPIFDDFWERMLASIRALRAKPQRTVFRLTLVEGYNMKSLDDYCALIELGEPDFIEVKGVTYCGNSDASPITMKHVPFHHEVVKFCNTLASTLAARAAARAAARTEAGSAAQTLRRRGTIGGGETSGQLEPELEAAASGAGLPPPQAAGEQPRRCTSGYAIACEHEHSCCVLMADRRFERNGAWHTWIDYGKFFSLLESGRTDFDGLEYAAPTPGWAIFNSAERGFDPEHTRHYRKKRVVPGGGC